jgi:hypothetical protein
MRLASAVPAPRPRSGSWSFTKHDRILFGQRLVNSEQPSTEPEIDRGASNCLGIKACRASIAARLPRNVACPHFFAPTVSFGGSRLA